MSLNVQKEVSKRTEDGLFRACQPGLQEEQPYPNDYDGRHFLQDVGRHGGWQSYCPIFFLIHVATDQGGLSPNWITFFHFAWSLFSVFCVLPWRDRAGKFLEWRRILCSAYLCDQNFAIPGFSWIRADVTEILWISLHNDFWNLGPWIWRWGTSWVRQFRDNFKPRFLLDYFFPSRE